MFLFTHIWDPDNERWLNGACADNLPVAWCSDNAINLHENTEFQWVGVEHLSGIRVDLVAHTWCTADTYVCDVGDIKQHMVLYSRIYEQKPYVNYCSKHETKYTKAKPITIVHSTKFTLIICTVWYCWNISLILVTLLCWGNLITSRNPFNVTVKNYQKVNLRLHLQSKTPYSYYASTFLSMGLIAKKTFIVCNIQPATSRLISQ